MPSDALEAVSARKPVGWNPPSPLFEAAGGPIGAGGGALSGGAARVPFDGVMPGPSRTKPLTRIPYPEQQPRRSAPGVPLQSYISPGRRPSSAPLSPIAGSPAASVPYLVMDQVAGLADGVARGPSTRSPAAPVPRLVLDRVVGLEDVAARDPGTHSTAAPWSAAELDAALQNVMQQLPRLDDPVPVRSPPPSRPLSGRRSSGLSTPVSVSGVA